MRRLTIACAIGVLAALIYPATSMAFAHGSAPSSGWHLVGDFLTSTTAVLLPASLWYLWKIRTKSLRLQGLGMLQFLSAGVAIGNWGSFWLFITMATISLVCGVIVAMKGVRLAHLAHLSSNTN